MKDAAEKKKSSSSKQNEGKTRFKSAVIRSRSIPTAVISHFVAKITSLEEHVEEVLQYHISVWVWHGGF